MIIVVYRDNSNFHKDFCLGVSCFWPLTLIYVI